MADDKFETALKGVHVAPVTLDNKWHRLFNNTDVDETGEMKKLEEELNNLLKRQGKVNSELKDLKKIKADLMDEIVSHMDGIDSNADKESQKKVEESRRLIDEINEKVEGYNDEVLDLPHMIDEVNFKLMLLTMEACYKILQENTEDIDKISEWITNMRIELKRNVLKKQKMEIKNVELYSYMHDIFGPEVINIFDIKYDIEKKKQEILDRQQAIREEKQRATSSPRNK
ncbi:MAG: hypothetical protein K6F99_06490 [Lachnospiraceae bacterium]|nr:hypothetical protein [Lachnospiraceae bacterium]